MTAPKLTDWFPPEVKPERVGVYETDVGCNENGYQFWDGKYWKFWGFDAKDAYNRRHSKSCYQNPKWRGRANNPKRKK